MRFNTDIEGLKRWKGSILFEGKLTMQDVSASISAIKSRQSIEQNPPIIPFNIGWSPYEAKDFLKASGIETGFYKKCYEDEWMACSPYLVIDDELIESTIAYYVSGNSDTAKELKLSLNMNSICREKEHIFKFHEYAKTLYILSLQERFPKTLSAAILSKKNFKFKHKNKIIVFSKPIGIIALIKAIM